MIFHDELEPLALPRQPHFDRSLSVRRVLVRVRKEVLDHASKERRIESRLADWLVRHSPAVAAGCPAVFDLPMTKKVLAAQLGVTSETLSRTFARFRDEGLIRVVGPRVHVLNSNGLKGYAEPEL